MKNTGFVYLWFDRKHRRFYVGSHWGSTSDGYICSSNWMKKAHAIRPNDFKRRILRNGIPTKKEMLEEEQRWLDMIKSDEISPNSSMPRYYNLRVKAAHWSSDPKVSKTIGQKIRATRIANGSYVISEENKRKLIERNTGRPGGMKGKRQSEEAKAKIATAHTGMKRSDEARKNIAASLRGKPLSKAHREAIMAGKAGKTYGGWHQTEEVKELIRQARKGNTDWRGRKHTEETKKKMSESRKAMLRDNPEVIERFRNSQLGRVFSEETRRKMSEAARNRKRTAA